MIRIELEQVQEALTYFQIEPEAVSFRIVTNVQEQRKGKRAVRMVAIAELLDGAKYVVRFLNEREYVMDVSNLQLTTEKIEKQSVYSELLREHGMRVPVKYKRDGHFCMPYEMDGVPLDVTVEECLGRPIEAFTPELFYGYGKLFGEMHKIAEDCDFRIGFGILYQEVLENRMNYLGLFSGAHVEYLDQKVLKEATRLHNERKETIRQLWPTLPRYTVQSDIYSCNNVAMTDQGLGFYDFNIAADEVLLGDMLHPWLRTIYDVNNEEKRKSWDLEHYFREYLRGYEEYRKLTPEEEKALPLVYATLGSIYMTRYVAELLVEGYVDEAEEALKQVCQLLRADKVKIL